MSSGSVPTPSGKKSADIILKELAQRQLEVEQQRMPPPQGTLAQNQMGHSPYKAHCMTQVKQAALASAGTTCTIMEDAVHVQIPAC